MDNFWSKSCRLRTKNILWSPAQALHEGQGDPAQQVVEGGVPAAAPAWYEEVGWPPFGAGDEGAAETLSYTIKPTMKFAKNIQ